MIITVICAARSNHMFVFNFISFVLISLRGECILQLI